MKKWAFTIIIFLSAIFIMTSRVKAGELDFLPNFTNLSGATSYYVIYDIDFSRMNPGWSDDNDSYIIIFFNRPMAFLSFNESYIQTWNEYGWSGLASHSNNVSGYSNVKYSAAYQWYYNQSNNWSLINTNSYWSSGNDQSQIMRYTSIDLYGRGDNNLYFSAGYSNLPTFEHIGFDSTYNDEYAFVTIDFSDYLDSGYRYYYGYDDLLMYDITDQMINGIYNFNAYYDDTIYAKVVDSLGNVVSEGDYEINYGMLDQYSLHFHVDGINNGNDFVKLVTDNTDYSNFWTEDEEILLYFNTRVVTGFYTDSELTNQIQFDGTWCPARDLDIYMTWTNRLPMYNRNVYISDEKLKLDLTWFNWYEEAQDYVVFYSSSQTGENYTFNYAKYLNQQTYTFNVHYNESITLQFGKINEDHSITIFTTHSFNVENWVEHNIDEETREQMELIEQYRQEQESPNGIDGINSFIRIIAVPINFIKEIFVYIWLKMNIYIKSAIITIWSTILITAIIKIIRR